MKKFNYCEKCNDVYEIVNPVRKCIKKSHSEGIGEMTDKQYIKWLLKNKPTLKLKQRKTKKVIDEKGLS